jgi:ABC-type multidrug transport system permease subunit
LLCLSLWSCIFSFSLCVSVFLSLLHLSTILSCLFASAFHLLYIFFSLSVCSYLIPISDKRVLQ